MSAAQHVQLQDAIIVGVDGSSSSQAALRWAAFEGTALDCEIVAVQAWHDVIPYTGMPMTGMYTDVSWDPALEAEKALVATVDEWLLPSLAHLGRAWQRGEVSVAGEHFVSAAMQGRLATAFQSLAPTAHGGPRVVAGLPRGARHELGVLAFASVLRSRGVSVTYLGGDLPLEAWVATARAIDPASVVLAAPTVEDLPAVREAVQALQPLTRVLLGGAHQDEVEDAELLGHWAGAAANALSVQLLTARLPGVRAR